MDARWVVRLETGWTKLSRLDGSWSAARSPAVQSLVVYPRSPGWSVASSLMTWMSGQEVPPSTGLQMVQNWQELLLHQMAMDLKRLEKGAERTQVSAEGSAKSCPWGRTAPGTSICWGIWKAALQKRTWGSWQTPRGTRPAKEATSLLGCIGSIASRSSEVMLPLYSVQMGHSCSGFSSAGFPSTRQTWTCWTEGPWRGLRACSISHKLRELGCCDLEKRELRGILHDVYKYLLGCYQTYFKGKKGIKEKRARKRDYLVKWVFLVCARGFVGFFVYLYLGFLFSLKTGSLPFLTYRFELWRDRAQILSRTCV